MLPTSTVLPYLLDTNIVVHAARGGSTWEQIKRACDPLMAEPRPYVCVVTDGEVRALAKYNQWGDLKQEQARFFLNHFIRAGIHTTAVLEAYAEIDTYSRQQGIRMGKNDLWIAAVASADNLVLVATDRDFDHLDGVFLSRLYVNPALLMP